MFLFWLRSKEVFKFSGEFLNITGLTLPYDEDFPACFSQLSKITFIPSNIAFPLRFPELFVGFWYHPAVMAFMYVPEAAVNKNYLAMSGKNQVRLVDTS